MSYNSKTIDMILKAQSQDGVKSFQTFQQFFKQNNQPPMLFEKCSQNITPKNIKAQRSFSNKTFESLKETKRKSQTQIKHPEFRMIQIYARIKPGDKCSFTYDPQTIKIDENQYSFDRIFNQYTSQEEIFEIVAQQTVQDLINQTNGCLMAYGQTGSGKTHTMFGTTNQQGIVLKTFAHIFNTQISKLQISILEIYKDHIYDLISGVQDLKLKEDMQTGFYVDGLKKIQVENLSNCQDILILAEENRHVAETKLNALSSRSHLILTIYYGKNKLYLVDLAGSEKVNKTGAVGETLQEAKKINYSLSCLGHVIQCLSQGQDHVPYRDSKLTKLLQDSLQAECRTSIIVTISPELRNIEETISSLKFAQRARFIKKEIRLATQKKTYKDLELEVSQLKQELLETKQRMSETSSVSQFQYRYTTNDSEIPCTESQRLTYRSMQTENKENKLPNLRDQLYANELELEGKINQILIELSNQYKESNLDLIKKKSIKIQDLTCELKTLFKTLINTNQLNNNSQILQNQFINLQQDQNKQLQKIEDHIKQLDPTKQSFQITVSQLLKSYISLQKQGLEDMQMKLEKINHSLKNQQLLQDYNSNHLALKLVVSPNRQQLKRSSSKTNCVSTKYLRNNTKK